VATKFLSKNWSIAIGLGPAGSIFEISKYDDPCLWANGTPPFIGFGGEDAHCSDCFWSVWHDIILSLGEDIKGIKLPQSIIFFVIRLDLDGSI
jgi:hypothetical protein